ncbi:MAG: hypothetical protein J2P54_22100, partial [Bradyrhizobiaceae bacterium]|nr:hypothetical protein [Bradyrhizobiaceae bacterium]
MPPDSIAARSFFRRWSPTKEPRQIGGATSATSTPAQKRFNYASAGVDPGRYEGWDVYVAWPWQYFSCA